LFLALFGVVVVADHALYRDGAVYADAAAHSANEAKRDVAEKDYGISRVVVESCRGCRLNKLPLVGEYGVVVVVFC
jgi:hypothetical protein